MRGEEPMRELQGGGGGGRRLPELPQERTVSIGIGTNKTGVKGPEEG